MSPFYKPHIEGHMEKDVTMNSGKESTLEKQQGREQSVRHWHQYAMRIILLSCIGLLLYLMWYIPYWFPQWAFVVSHWLTEHPLFVFALSIGLVFLLFWLLLWKLPQWQVSALPDAKDRLGLESQSRQTLAQIVGGVVLLLGLYFTAQTLKTTQEGQITDRFTKAM